MYQQTLGRFLSRDPLAENGMDVLTDTGFYGERLAAMRANPWYYGGNGENLYTYVDNNPINLTDPSGLAALPPRTKCSIWINCIPVFGGTHCGIYICSNPPYGCTSIDGGSTTGNTLPPYGCVKIVIRDNKKRSSSDTVWGPENVYPPSVCDCIARYAVAFTAKMPCIDYLPLNCNSNWALNCILKHCKIQPAGPTGFPGTAASTCEEIVSLKFIPKEGLCGMFSVGELKTVTRKVPCP